MNKLQYSISIQTKLSVLSFNLRKFKKNKLKWRRFYPNYKISNSLRIVGMAAIWTFVHLLSGYKWKHVQRYFSSNCKKKIIDILRNSWKLTLLQGFLISETKHHWVVGNVFKNLYNMNMNMNFSWAYGFRAFENSVKNRTWVQFKNAMLRNSMVKFLECCGIIFCTN